MLNDNGWNEAMHTDSKRFLCKTESMLTKPIYTYLQWYTLVETGCSILLEIKCHVPIFNAKEFIKRQIS